MTTSSNAGAPCEDGHGTMSVCTGSLLHLLRQFSAGLGRPEAAQIRERRTLPQPQVQWLSLGVGRSSTVVNSLHHLKSKLDLLSERILDSVGCSADTSPTAAASNRELAALSNELSEITRLLADCNLEDLAMPSRSQHSALCSLSGELFAKLRGVTKTSAHEAGFEEKSKVSFTVALSQEQQKAVECPRSLFLQGRSGTGKTLVAVRRVLWHRQQEGNQLTQLFIVKSSLLRDAALKEFTRAGVPISKTIGAKGWASSGVTCITWDQLVSHLIGQRSSVGFSKFLSSYWPYLRSRAPHLHPNMVWTEFCSRLRPFGPKWQSGLTKEEYMKDDMMAQGVRLTTADQKAIYDMFNNYMNLKHNHKELDDLDIAARLLKHIHEFQKVNRLYADEVQDFSPAQLMVLLATCSHPDGVTMAGDTCQTINPGSAFSFKDIMQAFRGGFEIPDHRGTAEQAQLLFLHYNYRCAAGVAFLANSVTWLLLQRFPHCADHIDEETMWQQLVELPLVVTIQGGDYADLLMGTGAKRQSSVDMRAATILVPDNAMRDVLHAKGVDVTILTISEAKGLEFDLVVICGFLSTCLSGDMLGSLANDESEESQLAAFAAADDPGQGTFLQLNSSFYKLTGAIHDLKALYTGITRARCGCVLLECPTEICPWTALISRWQGEVLVEWVNDPWQFVACAETGCSSHVHTPAHANQQTTDNSHPSKKDPEDDSETHDADSQSSVNSALISMMQWLQMELEAREGKEHRKARSALRAEMNRLEDDGQPQLDFCNQFWQQFGLLCNPEFAWDVEDPGPIQDVADAATLVDTPATKALPTSMEPHPSELPPILHLMRRRYKSNQPLMDMAVSLEELHAFTFQLLAHALDDIGERSEVFKEVHTASLQGLALANDVLNIQLQNFGRRAAPREMQSQADIQKYSTTWRQQLCTVFQEVSRPQSWRGMSSLSKWNRLNVWVHVFSFIAPADVTDLPNAVLLVGERVAEHARLQHSFKSAAIAAKAGLLLSSTPSWTFSEDRLRYIQEGLLEHVRLDNFVGVVWPDLQAPYKELQASRIARWKCLIVAMLFRAKARTWKEVFDKAWLKKCPLENVPAMRWRRLVTLIHFKDKVRKAHELSTKYKDALRDSHARVMRFSIATHPLKEEFGSTIFLRGIHASDIQRLQQRAASNLQCSEQMLSTAVKEAGPRLGACREASRAYLAVERWHFAATALTEAVEIRKEMCGLVPKFPVLSRWDGPLRHVLCGFKHECFQAACYWARAAQQSDNPSPMMAWRSAEALFGKIGCPVETAVCVSQQGKWRDVISLLSKVPPAKARSLMLLSAAAFQERLVVPATAALEPPVQPISEHDVVKEKEDNSKFNQDSGLARNPPLGEVSTVPCQVGNESTLVPKIKKRSQNVFTLDMLKEQQHSQVQVVAATLLINKADAIMLLRCFRWSSDDFINAYISDAAGVRQKWGVSDEEDASTIGDDAVCGICYCDSSLVVLPCRGHGYCQDCWSNYLTTAIEDGKACLDISCPEPTCKERAKPWLVHQLCSPQLIHRYERFWLESYVESNPTLKWCPGKGCSCVAYGLASDGFAVNCECGLDWCFACADEDHNPVPCSIVRSWRERSHEEDPDFEFIFWAKKGAMQGSVKPCPKCSRLIEKNGGCMHMTCDKNAGGCGHEFHWICLCPWAVARRDHPQPCAKAPETSSSSAEEDFLAAQKFRRCRERFDAHREAQAMTVDLVHACEELSRRLGDSLVLPARHVDFLPEAAAQVCRGRRILKWTIAFEYFLQGLSSERELFNFHQGRLEETIELLSDVVENTNWKDQFQAASFELFEQKRSEALSLCQVLQEAFQALDTWMNTLQISP